jgi:hypothetical protein
MAEPALPGLEDIAPSDLSFVVAFLRDHGFASVRRFAPQHLLLNSCLRVTPAAQAETLLMSELEARIIASTSGQTASEETGIAVESCAGSSAQEDRCVGAFPPRQAAA